MQWIRFSDLGEDPRSAMQGHRWLVMNAEDVPQATAALGALGVTSAPAALVVAAIAASFLLQVSTAPVPEAMMESQELADAA